MKPAMKVTATDAENHWGHDTERMKRALASTAKNGQAADLVVPVTQEAALGAPGQGESLALRRKEFNEKYKDWIVAQNELVEAHGLWCEGLMTGYGRS